MEFPKLNTIRNFVASLGFKTQKMEVAPNAQFSRKESERVFPKINYQSISRVDMEMQSLRDAIDMARDPMHYDREALYGIYTEVEADTHLAGVLSIHTAKVLRERFEIVDSKTGKIDEEATALFKQKWFKEFRELSIKTPLWGHSLIEPIIGKKEGKPVVVKVLLAPRHHVSPERRLLLPQPYIVSSGISYEEELGRTLIELGDNYYLGTFQILAKEAIRKIYSDNDWGLHSERYGMPVTYMRTSETRPAEINKKVQSLSSLGANGFLLTDSMDEVSYLESTRGHEMYEARLKRADEKISLIIIGSASIAQEKSFVGSAEVSERIAGDFKIAQLQSIAYDVNDILIPFLINNGFNLKGKEIRFPALEEDMTEKKQEVKQEDTGVNTPPPQKKKLNNSLETCECGCDGAQRLNLADPKTPESSEYYDILEALAKLVHEGKLPEDVFQEDKFKELIDKVHEELWGNYRNNYSDADSWTIEDKKLLELVDKNIYQFSGAKSLAQLEELKNVVYEGGKLVSWTEFVKKAKQIDANYNLTYLEAERNAVQIGATMGSKWVRLEAAAEEYPYLKYVTEGDSRVRPEHAKLNGIILPLDDPFWKKFYPPNGWRCRCDVEQLAADEIGEKDISDSDKSQKAAETAIKDKYWHQNQGQTGLLFPETHQYFKNLSAEEKKQLEALAEANQQAAGI